MDKTPSQYPFWVRLVLLIARQSLYQLRLVESKFFMNDVDMDYTVVNSFVAFPTYRHQLITTMGMSTIDWRSTFKFTKVKSDRNQEFCEEGCPLVGILADRNKALPLHCEILVFKLILLWFIARVFVDQMSNPVFVCFYSLHCSILACCSSKTINFMPWRATTACTDGAIKKRA